MTVDADADADADVYDWWSRHPRALEMLYCLAFLGREASFRRRAMAALDPSPGEHVLELGCGTGNSFAAIRDGVGPGGAVVGLDFSRGMVRAAHERVGDAGWTNVHVVRGDACHPPVDGAVDAAYASMSLSAVPEPERAVVAIHDALRPGGRFVVLDARPFSGGLGLLLNPFIVPTAEWATDWVPGVDAVAALQRTFASVSVDSFNAGSIFVATARKGD
jgi:demethylmenaquinone methyltransferase/2-methoxy-6-polyprenyl-1,4-benzoquinol methylase